MKIIIANILGTLGCKYSQKSSSQCLGNLQKRERLSLRCLCTMGRFLRKVDMVMLTSLQCYRIWQNFQG